MIINLDFNKKVITLSKEVNLKDFYKKIKIILPEWEEWSLKTNSTIINPTQIIEKKVWENPYWYNQPYVTYENKTHLGYELHNKTNFNLEI